MADSPNRPRVAAELAILRKQQFDSIENASFVGWNVKTMADHDERADRIELLMGQLAKLEKP
jgi:hypothetical protein